MRTQHDPVAFYRHVLRSGDVDLARRVGSILIRDPVFRDRAEAELRHLPAPGGPHATEGGQLLDRLLERLDEE